jgi:endonuclease/exonuclease/phosphatase family metal-dependent hydrolase
VGEVGVTESERDEIKLPGIARAFEGFNRNPYLASFAVEGTTLLLANAHLYYGETDTATAEQESIERRQLEAFAIGRWCDLRRKSRNAYTSSILAIGDFNLPERIPGDPIYDALTKRGLALPPHTTRIPRTNIANSADYDQIAFVPGLKRHIKTMGVFDFDGTIFRALWNPPATSYWRACAKYYISDHRPLWAQVDLPP